MLTYKHLEKSYIASMEYSNNLMSEIRKLDVVLFVSVLLNMFLFFAYIEQRHRTELVVEIEPILVILGALVGLVSGGAIGIFILRLLRRSATEHHWTIWE